MSYYNSRNEHCEADIVSYQDNCLFRQKQEWTGQNDIYRSAHTVPMHRNAGNPRGEQLLT